MKTKLLMGIIITVLMASSVFAIVGHPAEQIFVGTGFTGNQYFNADVGIGPTAPLSTLHVEKSTLNDNYLVRFKQWNINGHVLNLTHTGNNGAKYIIRSQYNVGLGAPMEAFAVRADGRVGIGTASPTEELDVAGDIKASGTICDSVGCIGDGDSDWTISGSDIYSVISGGNVGIGINTPSSILHVEKSRPGQYLVNFKNWDTNGDVLKLTQTGSSSIRYIIRAQNNNGASDAFAVMADGKVKIPGLAGTGTAKACILSDGTLCRNGAAGCSC